MLSNTHPGYFVQRLPGTQCPFPLDTLSSVSKHLSFFRPYMFRNHNQQRLFHGNPTQSMATSHRTYAPSSSPTYKLLAWNDLCLRLAQSSFAICHALTTRLSFAALVLLQRLKAHFPTAQGSSGRRLFTSAFMLFSKVIYDNTYSNKLWSIVAQGMFQLKEINQKAPGVGVEC